MKRLHDVGLAREFNAKGGMSLNVTWRKGNRTSKYLSRIYTPGMNIY